MSGRDLPIGERLRELRRDTLTVFGVRHGPVAAGRRGVRVGSVESTLWSAVAVARVLTLGYITIRNLIDLASTSRPGLALAASALMVGWTVVATTAYARRSWRRWPLMTADLVVACGLILLTVAIQGRDRIDAGVPTYPSTWVVAAVLAWAVRGGPLAGLAAALAVAVANVVERGGLVSSGWDNLILVGLAAVVAGYAARLARRTEVALADAVAAASATAERDRLSRQIHDGVLQVLALVRRRGAELGGAAAELGVLAGEQEQALRALVAGGPPSPPGDGLLDVRELLLQLVVGPHRSLAAPATPVLLPGHAAAELVAATRAALHNVATHVGVDAPAWVLLEDDDLGVLVTVRDEGPGLSEQRLAQAAAEGRLGVAQSIRGRLADCGGTATFVSAPGQGTEVELRVPRR